MNTSSGESSREIETDFEDIVTKLMSVDGDSGSVVNYSINNLAVKLFLIFTV